MSDNGFIPRRSAITEEVTETNEPNEQQESEEERNSFEYQNTQFYFLALSNALSAKINRRLTFITTNFLHDLTLECAFWYPIQGVFTFFKTPSYWSYSLVLAFCFFCIFMIVAVLYYAFILPILLAWAVATLGPIGFIIVHIQWLLQANAMAIKLTKILVFPTVRDELFDAVLINLGHTQFLESAKVLPFKIEKKTSHMSIEYWVINFPQKCASFVFHLIVSLALFLLSLVPIFGPSIVNQILSPKRGYSYAERYLKLKKLNKEQLNDAFYEHLGKYTAFGMIAGILELIPIISIFTLSSNIIAGAMWASDDIKKIKLEEKILHELSLIQNYAINAAKSSSNTTFV